MKLSTLFVLAALFSMKANDSYGQRTKVTLSMNNVTVGQVIDKIEGSTEFEFVYIIDDVDLNRKVSVSAKKEGIADILRRVFKNTKTTFNLNDKRIYLVKRIEPDVPDLGEKTSPQQIQQSYVTGTVTDENGQPLPGANILEKGTTNGTQTDFDGNFTINVADENATLVISYIGFTTQELSVNGQATITVELKEDLAKLEEVVLTGYTSERKSDLTGAVAIVDMGDVVSQPVASVDNMLQGQVSGVNVVSSGSPGGASTLRIRGYSTIRNNDPLYVIDGVPTTTGINLINPNDIASLQVLKDASSSSIYGSRAANGVVIITTKKGKKKPKFPLICIRESRM